MLVYCVLIFRDDFCTLSDLVANNKPSPLNHFGSIPLCTALSAVQRYSDMLGLLKVSAFSTNISGKKADQRNKTDRIIEKKQLRIIKHNQTQSNHVYCMDDMIVLFIYKL